MNRNQILQIELEKLKTRRLNAEVRAKRALLIARNIPEFCKLDDEIRHLQLNLSKEDNAKKISQLKKQIESLKKEASAVLTKNKFDSKSLQVNYHCKLCNDTGYANGKICKCLDNAIQRELIKQSGINNQLNFTFAKSDNKIVNSNKSLDKAYKIAEKYVAEFPNFKFPNLVFIGDVGAGKTFLLECIANALIEKMHYVVFSTAFDLNKTMINAFGVPFGERQSLLSPIFECDLLIIDDLGSEPVLKNSTIPNLFTIINERQRNNLPTIVSTNLNYEEIQTRYGDRIMSRLFNKRTSLAIPFVGKDLRQNTK